MCDRIRLVRAGPCDHVLIQSWLRRPELRAEMGGSQATPTPREERQETYMIIRNIDEQTIGYIQLTDINWARHSAEIRMCIASPEHRSRGYGTEALTLMTGYLLERGLDSVYLRVLTDNSAAVRCYQKAGYVKTGVLRSDRFDNVGMFLMELNRPRFRSLHHG